ncbi:heparinase II/III family protein, partial [Thermodesulfobacteriota bacterium]
MNLDAKKILIKRGYSLQEIFFRMRQHFYLWSDKCQRRSQQVETDVKSIGQAFYVHKQLELIVSEKYYQESVKFVAQGVMNGSIDIFGNACRFDGKFPWKEDFIHSVSAQEGFWSDVQYLDAASVGDSKVIWELNRLQFLLPVAKAFFLTGDSSYYDWLKKTIKDWDEANPYPMGINWASSLELAFRVVVLDWVIRFLESALQEDEEFRHLLLQLLAIHGRHINRYLSTYFSPNTHLSGEALGLYLLGTRYPALPNAGKWRETGRKILLACLDAHILPDGGYYERSLWYHRYTIEIYLLFAFLAEEAQDSLPGTVREKLGSLLDFMLHALRSDGTFPLIGDDDGGRFLALDDLDPSDARGLMAACAVLLGRGDLKAVAGDNTETALWLWGRKGLDVYDRLASAVPGKTGAVFPQTGYAFLRTGWEDDAVLVSMDAGPLGTDNCGHGHADALSLTLSIGTQQVIVDPGTFSYSLDIRERNRFRNHEAHSSPCISGAPQSIPSKSPFHWRRIHQDCRFTSSSVGWDMDMLSGACTDVASSGKHVSIGRSIVLLKPKRLLFVWDRFTGPAGLSAVTRFILHGR